MAFGLVPDSGSSQINGEVLGGLVTGTNGEFLALPISSTVLGGLSNLDTNEWSRFYLSDSFGAASSSIIQALNYLSASIKDNADADVEGPASSNDTAIARFDGTSGKVIQNTSQVLISDAGALSSSATAHFVDGMTGKNLAVTGAISGATLAVGGDEFTVSQVGAVAGGAGGDSYSLAANGAISGANAITAGTNLSGAGAVGGASLTAADLFSVNNAGVVSSSTATTLGNLILNDDSTSCLVLSGSMTGSGLATFTNTTVAQGGGYRAAVIVSSSAISTAADAAAIPKLVLQGTDNLGNLSDFMISVSGGMLRAQKLTPGTWPL